MVGSEYNRLYGRFSGLVQNSLALLAAISSKDNCSTMVGGSGVDLNTSVRKPASIPDSPMGSLGSG
ncbi:hypothetical protein KI387_009375, partial [Taxus chinensis]